ncbi:MAG: hypothetical protein L6Q92_03960 [Phycisphaerae bacterium]|nr:hypothetical protein [Phycisphaerae bacterium]
MPVAPPSGGPARRIRRTPRTLDAPAIALLHESSAASGRQDKRTCGATLDHDCTYLRSGESSIGAAAAGRRTPPIPGRDLLGRLRAGGHPLVPDFTK